MLRERGAQGEGSTGEGSSEKGEHRGGEFREGEHRERGALEEGSTGEGTLETERPGDKLHPALPGQPEPEFFKTEFTGMTLVKHV